MENKYFREYDTGKICKVLTYDPVMEIVVFHIQGDEYPCEDTFEAFHRDWEAQPD